MDDFDDPPMTDLLRRWARKVRAAPNLGALHRELDRVDAGEVRSRRSWWRPTAALAASLLVALLVWSWLSDGGAGDLPILAGTPPQLLDTALAPQPEIVRGEPAVPFSVGEQSYVHYYAEQPGFAVVVLVRPPAIASLLTPQPVALSVDDRPLGPYRLAGDPGSAALLVVTSEVEPTAEQVRQILAATAAAVRAAPVGSESELCERVRAAFEAARGLRAACVPFVLR